MKSIIIIALLTFSAYAGLAIYAAANANPVEEVSTISIQPIIIKGQSWKH